jgi:hypothetical protein
MKKTNTSFAFAFFALLLVLCPWALAQTTANSTVATTTSAVASPTINPSQTINFPASDPGQGRWFSNAVQPFEAPVLPYFGPWNTGANILDDLRTMPQDITPRLAKAMYHGGVKVRINYLYDPPAHPDHCKLLFSLPSKPLMVNGKQATNDKNEPLFVLDEQKFTRVAYIFLQGDKNADTADVIAKAAQEAIKMGANGIFVIKKVTLTSVSASGWGFGAGAVNGFLTGPGLDKAQSYSAGTGYNRATTKPVYREGMVVMAVLE